MDTGCYGLILLAFLVGGTLGVFVMALMVMAAHVPRIDPRKHDPLGVHPTWERTHPLW
jgi:hypothetical protein